MTTIKTPVTQEELANAIDSPTVAALAKIFSEPDHALSNSERIVYVLAQRLNPGVAQTARELTWQDRDAIKAAISRHCHVNMKWPATAQIDNSHIDDLLAELRPFLALTVVSSTSRAACHDHPTRRCTPDDCCQRVSSKVRGAVE